MIGLIRPKMSEKSNKILQQWIYHFEHYLPFNFEQFLLVNIFCSIWNIFLTWFHTKKKNSNTKAYFRTFGFERCSQWKRKWNVEQNAIPFLLFQERVPFLVSILKQDTMLTMLARETRLKKLTGPKRSSTRLAIITRILNLPWLTWLTKYTHIGAPAFHM